MSRTPSQDNIDTSRIKRISTEALEAYNENSDKHDRINLMEKVMSEQTKRIDAINDNLHEGSIEFLKLRHSIDNLTETIGTIKAVLFWFLGTAGGALIVFSGSVLWWVVKNYAISTNGVPS